MNRNWLAAAFCGGMLMVMVLDTLNLRSFAQENAKTGEKKEREKAKGYLPPFYRDVIDGVQREKIYTIQNDYDAKINPLLAQVKTLRDERDAAIAALLTPEQKKRLGELADESRLKKAADSKAKSSLKANETK